MSGLNGPTATAGSSADGLEARNDVERKGRWGGGLAESPNCRNPDSDAPGFEESVHIYEWFGYDVPSLSNHPNSRVALPPQNSRPVPPRGRINAATDR